jgi:hypothetical protein
MGAAHFAEGVAWWSMAVVESPQLKARKRRREAQSASA